MRKNYPSDIIYEQFELIESDLTSAKKQEQPRKYSLYDIFCAVFIERRLHLAGNS